MTPPSDRATVLTYHAVGNCPKDQDPHNLFVSNEVFAKQMAYLAKHRHVVSLKDLFKGSASSRLPTVAITFDDGYRCVATLALPILKHFGFPATVFVPTKWIGRRNTWDPPSNCAFDIMTMEEIRQMHSSGIEIGSHGHAHIDMAASPLAVVQDDIKRSIEILESATQERPRFLAYPYGKNSSETRRVAREHGFAAAFSIDDIGRGSYAYERVAVTALDGSRLFALKTSGRYIRLRKSRALSRGYSLLHRVLPDRRRNK